MKLAFIVGARPNFIKIAPIYDIIHNYSEVKPILIHTGQHFDLNMSEFFFHELNLPKPDFNLNVAPNTQTKQTAEIMIKCEDLFNKIKPDLVVVIGDVNSTIAPALVAAKMHIKLAHIEAGLRSFNKTMPEEVNRIVSDHLSDLLFAPSQTAISNLENEGLGSKSYFTGDVMFDAVLRNLPVATTRSDILKQLGIIENKYIFVTLHRPYNVDEPLKLGAILDELAKLDLRIVFPIHPRTKSIMDSNSMKLPTNFIALPPVGYLDSLMLQKNAYRVITDSGGVQKEAFFLHVPCITLRPETEWIETIECGANVLSSVENLSNIVKNYPFRFNNDIRPYGKGNASEIILELICKQ